MKSKKWALLGVLLAMFLCISLDAQAQQSYKRVGSNFEQVSTRESASTAQKTSFTFTDSKNNVYPIYITKTGRCFVSKISSRTGKTYKYYLKEDLSREVAKEVGITYQEKKPHEKK